MNKYVLYLCLFIPPYLNAAFNGNSAHSRANCGGFNESVTWNGIASHWWEVHSLHYRDLGKNADHILIAKLAYTWRSAAYHPTEAYSSRGDHWYVEGYHFYIPNDRPEIYSKRLEVVTMATNCNIYDGWWDK